eukprot:TRINITY_DN10834_c0_g1_i2.p1 TRINITY_DN10834_c0_g1~~TRINITY_DN10834_c0_g1_i2.p1  ORF type:complete len:126 (-),score=4.99 TRINITY_DN10834_c0_g1_i2:94-471(-)
MGNDSTGTNVLQTVLIFTFPLTSPNRLLDCFRSNWTTFNCFVQFGNHHVAYFRIFNKSYSSTWLLNSMVKMKGHEHQMDGRDEFWTLNLHKNHSLPVPVASTLYAVNATWLSSNYDSENKQKVIS